MEAGAAWWGSFGVTSGRTGFASLPRSGSRSNLHSFLRSRAESRLAQRDGLRCLCPRAFSERCLKPPPPQPPLSQVQGCITAPAPPPASIDGGCSVSHSGTACSRPKTGFLGQCPPTPRAAPLKGPLGEPLTCKG